MQAKLMQGDKQVGFTKKKKMTWNVPEMYLKCTLQFKSWGQYFFFKEINTFIHKDVLNWSKVMVKIVTKYLNFK